MILSNLIAQGNTFESTDPVPVTVPGAYSQGNGVEQVQNLFNNVIGFLTVVAGLAFILYFILGAIGWITGGGDQQKVENAKNQMTSAAIGLVIIVASYMIIGIVGAVLGFDILNFQNLPLFTQS